MKQLLGLLLVVVVAVAVTLMAQGNASKVLIFFGQYRIDMSLNFAVIAILLLFLVLYVTMRAWRASSQLPGKFKEYWMNRKQNALLKANTQGLIALITGDEQGAHKALNQASKTGIETDLSYLIRAMSAIQADRYDIAEEILNQEKAKVGEHSHALTVLRGKVALSKQDFSGALSMLEAMDPLAAKLPQVQRLRMLALMGLSRWQDALVQYRACVAVSALTNGEKNEALLRIYAGLGENAGQDAAKMQEVLSNAKPVELENMGVLRMLAAGLLRSGLVTAARTLLETALHQNYNRDLLPIYHQVAVLEPREALPNVERLLAQQPGDLRLLELAADVCEREQLWGKAISRFEAVYAKQPSAHVAGKLERLYESANQGERAKVWREKLNNHLQNDRQLA
ncbi:MAG: heme biosynthesis HemY N-terminal domain-containing protein [Pseudomonadota bacterium]|uniref:heme biosynthesis HemY N-terminal domain-containing protein n=1 Tax=Limnobacter alexandrii TaxID=2570352 RepID=UPI001107F2CD|nr:heme biosynthesis HemY N-terminal domain-containing protein [Limnobacter alexandrii]